MVGSKRWPSPFSEVKRKGVGGGVEEGQCEGGTERRGACNGDEK